MTEPRESALDMSTDEGTPPSFELDPPTPSAGDQLMGARIAARMFGSTEPVARKIAQYEIERRIGAGGMGVVYAARDTKLDRRVALKLLRRDRVGERAGERLLMEARALARLSHPNVVQVHELGEFDGAIFIAMEFVDGMDLNRWQKAMSPELGELLDAYIQAGHGLAAAHAMGVVHRDFKSSNVLRGVDGRVRVADFGLALQHDEPSYSEPTSARPTTRLAGTPGYMAPELFRGDPATDQSDQYAFCVALWEALTGELPFHIPARSLGPEPTRPRPATLAARRAAARPRRGSCPTLAEHARAGRAPRASASSSTSAPAPARDHRSDPCRIRVRVAQQPSSRPDQRVHRGT
ncbi:MAG: serine/threonine protein kinase [Deltaproteobacteria bacterium]|nr:serine/threonine protein kinase [Deltaproteobacteria bacterium]